MATGSPPARTGVTASAAASTTLPAFLNKQNDAIMESFSDLEWSQNQRYQEGRQQPHSAASAATASRWARLSGDEVLKRNRYGNIDPFHSNRVRLRVKAGESDYINASPIVLQTSTGCERKYIACQGPTAASATHMWQMIAQHTADPAVIVMLTQTHEGHREKCWPYFPTSTSSSIALDSPAGTAKANGTFHGTVKLLSEEFDEACATTVRTLLLETTDPTSPNPSVQSKRVVHCLFERWPDFGVPEGDDRAALLALIRKTREAYRQSSRPLDNGHELESSHEKEAMYNPRVVHCSAGVGRSGTFIALDHLLAELESGALDSVEGETDHIAQVVDQLRQQRMMMVQGEGQYQFIYHTLRAEWTKRAQKNNSAQRL